MNLSFQKFVFYANGVGPIRPLLLNTGSNELKLLQVLIIGMSVLI